MAAPLGVPPGAAATPRRGTRPRNRRRLIIDAAAGLLYRNGYPHVAMIDIADAVAVGASALYRHFPGKQELLAAVLLDRIGSFRQQLADNSGDAAGTAATAATAAANTELGVLWLREARHLDPSRRGEIDQEVDALIATLTDRLARPDLDAAQSQFLVWSLVGVLVSPSFHHVRPPGNGLAAVLRDIVSGVERVELPALTAPSAGPRGLAPLAAGSRREQILVSAIDLFSARGYPSVGIEDIGAAAGIVGTSIYRHFPTKADVLVAAMNRGAEWLRLDLIRTLAEARDPAGGLRGLLRSYARFAVEHNSLIDVLLSETSHLPEADQARIRQTQRDYVAEWVHLMRLLHPADDADVARIRVQAALTVTNTVTRSKALRASPQVEDCLVAVGRAVLRT